MADDMRETAFNIMCRSGMNSANNGALLQRDSYKKQYTVLSYLDVFTFCTCSILICLLCFVASFKLCCVLLLLVGRVYCCSCLVCVVAILCVFAVLCGHCFFFFYFRCRTAG